MKKRFSEEQIIGILREGEADEVVIRDVCRKHSITEQMFFWWRSKYGGMTISDAQVEGSGIGEREAKEDCC